MRVLAGCMATSPQEPVYMWRSCSLDPLTIGEHDKTVNTCQSWARTVRGRRLHAAGAAGTCRRPSNVRAGWRACQGGAETLSARHSAGASSPLSHGCSPESLGGASGAGAAERSFRGTSWSCLWSSAPSRSRTVRWRRPGRRQRWVPASPAREKGIVFKYEHWLEDANEAVVA